MTNLKISTATFLLLLIGLVSLAYSRHMSIGFFGPVSSSVSAFQQYRVSDGAGGWANYRTSDGVGGWENYRVSE